MDSVSGVGVLDKAVAILDALEPRALSLVELVEATGLSRATAHRLALALELHGFIERDTDGRFALGERLASRGLVAAARPVLEALRDKTGESVQLYVPRGDVRVCLVSLESPHGLRTIVPVGAILPMDRGSAAKIFRVGAYNVAESVEEREKGVASVSAAVHDADGNHIAAVSVSGPVERTTRSPEKRYGKAVLAAARQLEQSLL
ncbi:MAG TPA: IclR family transcriptional regulator [Acidimicrobiales bacterium]|nr:IclR family transcriptional regulator [Acidimicrobiales bacterium]